MSSALAMPLLVVNLGGEMMYVLNQRLVAQKIDPAKAQQVRDDVVGAMLNEDFLDELFRPHALYSFEATRSIFQRLAHCSIMKLNETSMSKLYDLMTMVFKYQLMSCRALSDLILLTTRHLDELSALVGPEVQAKLEACRERIAKAYGGMCVGQLLCVRQTLLDFLKGRKVKVSLLLQENLQHQNGSMVLDLNGPCPQGVPVPGSVCHFDREASVTRHYNAALAVFEVAKPVEFDEEAYTDTMRLLGANLYAHYRGQVTTAAGESKEPEEGQPDAEEKAQQAQEDLNLLAELIAPRRESSGARVRLSIFADDMDCFAGSSRAGDSDYAACGASKEADEDEPVRVIDGKAGRQSLQEQMGRLDFGVEAGASKEQDLDDDDVDLLDLMDQAAEEDDAGRPARKK